MAAPRLILLAGPNGAGKSTFAVRLRGGAFAGIPFLNADDIARSLAPGAPDAAAFEAGRELLRQRDSAIAARSDLMVETTLATRVHLRAIHGARNSGYTTRLLFVWIASVEVCLKRVASLWAAVIFLCISTPSTRPTFSTAPSHRASWR